jgi:hypothetical protein
MSTNRKCNASLIFGVVAIIAGTVLMLDRLGYVDAHLIFRLWPLILIALGINTLLQKRGGVVQRIGGDEYIVGSGRGNIIGGGMLILVGVLNLLFTLHYFRWSQMWPVMLIGFGLLMVWESQRPRQERSNVGGDGSAHSVFASVEKSIDTRDFREATVESVFGSIELDLGRAEMVEDKAYLNVACVFASVEVRIPDHWNVLIEANAVFGSCENKARPPLPSATPKTLIVRGDAVFGSIEIRN